MSATPICPRTISVGYDEDEKPVIHGVACVGSDCAAWTPAVMKPGEGYCGLPHASQTFPDPAKPEKAK